MNAFRSALCLFGVTLLACGGQSALCSFRGTVNAPEQRTMRRNLMAKGLEQFCKQMLYRNAPLRVRDDDPAMGRFFPQTCTQAQMDNGDLFIRFAGQGYAYTNVTKKVTFSMQGAVQYNQDFLVAKDECDIYGYFRPRQIAASDFRIGKIENTTASYFNQLTPMGDQFGKQLVETKLRQGFTVIHDHEDHDDFGLGIVELGKRPYHPLAVHGAEKVPYENNRTEIHQNQRDFVGPIWIEDNGRALFFTAQVDGGVPVDLLVMSQRGGAQALAQYLENPQSGPLPENPIFAETIPAQMPGFRRTIPLPAGVYYVVLDNTATAGAFSPPSNGPFDDRAALVDYAVQIGDR